MLNIWARFIYAPLLDDRVRTIADGVSPQRLWPPRGVAGEAGRCALGPDHRPARVRAHGPRRDRPRRGVPASQGRAQLPPPVRAAIEDFSVRRRWPTGRRRRSSGWDCPQRRSSRPRQRPGKKGPNRTTAVPAFRGTAPIASIVVEKFVGEAGSHVRIPWCGEQHGARRLCTACVARPQLRRGVSKSRGGSHLYVLLGLGNNSPGLSDFGSRIGTARYSNVGPQSWRGAYGRPAGDRAIQERPAAHDHDRRPLVWRLRRFLDGCGTGPSRRPGPTGGDARPGGRGQISSNVRRSVNIRPGKGEDHYSVIAARNREVTGDRGGRTPRGASTRKADVTP